MTKQLGLFEGYGVELEYMIVDKNSLAVKPITDELIKSVTGEYVSDYDEEEIAWSNELVLHVIELKTNGPAKSINTAYKLFHKHVVKINNILENYNAKLLPAGTHPFMNSCTETKIWPHEYNAVYEAYDRIFGCKGHGWSNLQSTHINLPFGNDEEFGKLHAAIRILLPIIPAIAASTPIIDSKITGYLDTRLEYYRNNQAKIPSLTGKVIPERLFTQKEYTEKLLHKLYADIKPYDKDNIMADEWINSRGAIARFDRNTIEIRVIDIQESPLADLSLVALFDALLKKLIDGLQFDINRLMKYDEEILSQIFLDNIKTGLQTVITDRDYLEAFGIHNNKLSSKELWEHIISRTKHIFEKDNPEYLHSINSIIKYGNLSERILKAVNNDLRRENIITVYNELSASLANNTLFIP